MRQLNFGLIFCLLFQIEDCFQWPSLISNWTNSGTLLPLFCSRACFFPQHCRPLLPFSSLSSSHTRSRGRRPRLLGTTRHLYRRPLLLLGHRGTVQERGQFCWAHYVPPLLSVPPVFIQNDGDFLLCFPCRSTFWYTSHTLVGLDWSFDLGVRRGRVGGTPKFQSTQASGYNSPSISDELIVCKFACSSLFQWQL